MTAPVPGADRGIGPLAGFTAALQPGERHKGLFWAACRAAQDGLDPAPLIPAAEAAGLERPEIETVITAAAELIAKDRTGHEPMQKRGDQQQ